MTRHTIHALAALMLIPQALLAAEPIDIGSRRELFVDHHLIERMDGARLMLHRPQPREVVFKFDQPWEGIYSGYETVLKDGDLFRFYYRGMPEAKHDLDTEVTCVAESTDGVHWTRPKLGIHEVRGTKENNVVLARSRGCHNLAPFIDANPNCPPDQRYKALGGTGQPGLLAFASPDGLRWEQLQAEPVITEGAFDSQNNAFWSVSEQQYICYFRVFRDGKRWIARTTSEDFIHWTEPVDLELDGKPRQHLYTNQIEPYVRTAQIYLGLPTRFLPGRRVVTEQEARRIGTPKEWNYASDCTDILLASARGGANFRRTFLEAFIRPGLDLENWTSRANYAARGIVQTGDRELSLYVKHHSGYDSIHVRRYTLRPDGFVSAYGPYQGGELITKPFTFAGSRLSINFATSAAGGLHVEIQTPDGEPVEGFALQACPEIIGDRLEQTVNWKSGANLSSLIGQPIRLRFRLNDADLYSFQFTEESRFGKEMLADTWKELYRLGREKLGSLSQLPTGTTDVQPPARSIPPLDGCAWLSQDGVRAAWLSYKQVDDEMVSHLSNARVNSVFMKHGFHDLLRLETARWDGDRVVVDPNERTMQRAIENTRRAARHGIHVFWLANYELEQMLPHLERLGYRPAFAEGPGRYLQSGPHRDAAPLDPVFWRGITGAHGELVARLSREHPIDGLLYDTEHYAGGMMYLQNCGFSDPTFQAYVLSRQLGVSLEEVPAGKRYDFLDKSGRLADYYHFLEQQAFQQGQHLAARWHAINPHLVLGIWPLLDNWFSQGFLRGLGGAVPALGLSGVEYYHGSDQSQSMAEFFGSRNANLIYMPGFYPPYAYTVDQLERHVSQAIRTTKHYWMLGPHEELRRPEYQAALHDAFQFATLPLADDLPAVNLRYRVEQEANGPMLIVETGDVRPLETPRLSLWSTFGGAPLCEKQPMQRTSNGVYQARIPLLRRITNNQYLSDGFRSGASYHFDPTPREFPYEDPHHTKLVDGRAYGYFGTTVVWPRTVEQASVLFDLHREYRIARVEVAQPTKLEDRLGGPTQLRLQLGRQSGAWETSQPFEADFPISGKDFSEPDAPANDRHDPRHNRAWLSWKVDLPETPARWLRIEMQRRRKDSSISLGEVVLWASFHGEVQAGIQSDGRILRIDQGKRWKVGLP